MSKTLTPILASLKGIALSLDACGVSETGPWPLLVFRQDAGTTRFTLKLVSHPDAVRRRIERLLKSMASKGGTDVGNESRRASRWRPSLRRPPYSLTAARRFSKDGNLDAYLSLYPEKRK